MNNSDALLNTDAICKFMACSKPTVYKWIARGMPAKREGPKELSSSKAAINEWFGARARDGAKENPENKRG